MYYEKLGLSAARERGKIGGRAKKLSVHQLKMVKDLYVNKNNKIEDICKNFGISRSTLYRITIIK